MKFSTLFIIFIFFLFIRKSDLDYYLNGNKMFKVDLFDIRSNKISESTATIFLRASFKKKSDYHERLNLVEEINANKTVYSQIYFKFLGIGSILSPWHVLTSLSVVTEWFTFNDLRWTIKMLHVGAGLKSFLCDDFLLENNYRKVKKIHSTLDEQLFRIRGYLLVRNDLPIILELSSGFNLEYQIGISRVCFYINKELDGLLYTIQYGPTWNKKTFKSLAPDGYVFDENYFDIHKPESLTFQMVKTNTKRLVCNDSIALCAVDRLTYNCPADLGAPLYHVTKDKKILGQIGLTTYSDAMIGEECSPNYISKFILTSPYVYWMKSIVNDMCTINQNIVSTTTAPTEKPDLIVHTEKKSLTTFKANIDDPDKFEVLKDNIKKYKDNRVFSSLVWSLILSLIAFLVVSLSLILIRNRKKSKKKVQNSVKTTKPIKKSIRKYDKK